MLCADGSVSSGTSGSSYQFEAVLDAATVAH